MGLRNMKWRVAMCVLIGFSVIGYILLDANKKLNEARQMSDKCHQQQESLSAQLQVIYEHKNRLEKSLQLEKQQHKKTKDDLQNQFENFKEKEKQEAANRFNSLQQQHKMLQIQMEDAQEELHKVRESNLLLRREKEELENGQDKLDQIGQQKDHEIGTLKTEILQFRNEITSLNQELSEKKQNLVDAQDQLAICQKANDAHQPASGVVKVIGNQINERLAEKIEIVKSTEKKAEDVKNDVIAPPEILVKSAEQKDKLLQNDIDKGQLEQPQGADHDLNEVKKKFVEREADVQNPRPHVGREEEFQGNGLEQQENGDQDLDNMEEEDGANHHKEENKPFEEADFDQVIEDPKPLAPKDDVAVVDH